MYELDPGSTHAVLNFMLCYWMPRVINPHVAAKTRLRIAWVFVGEGGGTWLMEIAEGQTTVCLEPAQDVIGHLRGDAVDAAGQTTVRAEHPPKPDLTLTQTPDTFFKTLHLWHDPMVAMLTGEIKVQGFEHVRMLNDLFPEPPLKSFD